MLSIILALLLLVVGALGAAAGVVAPGSAACPSPANVGFRVVPIPDGPRTAVWYPTADAEAPFQYFPELSGAVAHGGAPASCGRSPLVVFSHGFGGCGTQSIFFTETLARHGYIVAAPDHKDALCTVDGTGSPRLIAPGQSFSRPERWSDTTHADRKNDVEQVLRWILTAADFERHIDASRIGSVGHSLGGYTILGLAGGWDRWRDDRIRAALVFSPYAAPFLAQSRLPSVRVPVMYQAADGDLMITPSSVRRAYAGSNPPNYYTQLRGGNHFEWTNLLCLGTKTISECLKRRPNGRVINTYGTAFLDAHLKGQTEALQRLDGSGLTEYRRSP